jgi:TPR repeat protein
MRCVVAAFLLLASAALLSPLQAVRAAPLDLDTVAPPDEPPEQLCDRLAKNPFAGSGPDEWGKPFQGIDSYRAIPACSEAAKLHPNERRFQPGLGLAYIAGDKKDLARPLLDKLVGEGDTAAMLSLAFISPETEAAELMHKAAERGDASAMLLFGMSELTGKGVAKNEIEGIRMIRRAAEAGSTRAMLILGHFYQDGSYGVGFNPEEGKRLIGEAAKRGDAVTENILLSLQEGTSSTSADPQQ